MPSISYSIINSELLRRHCKDVLVLQPNSTHTFINAQSIRCAPKCFAKTLDASCTGANIKMGFQCKRTYNINLHFVGRCCHHHEPVSRSEIRRLGFAVHCSLRFWFENFMKVVAASPRHEEVRQHVLWSRRAGVLVELNVLKRVIVSRKIPAQRVHFKFVQLRILLRSTRGSARSTSSQVKSSQSKSVFMEGFHD